MAGLILGDGDFQDPTVAVNEVIWSPPWVSTVEWRGPYGTPERTLHLVSGTAISCLPAVKEKALS